MDDQVERECPVCSVRYHADPARLKFGRQTTCSRVCSYKARAAGLDRSRQGQCGTCGKTIRLAPSKAKRAKHGLSFCSAICSYRTRKRVIAKPYVIVAEYDRSGAMRRAWITRRLDAKPYPDRARQKATADAIERLKSGSRVSKFERKAAEVFRRLGFGVLAGVAIRDCNGSYAHVFDLVIGVRRIAVECHGDYWHGGRWSWLLPDATQAKNLRYEERKLIAARARGIDIRILWEEKFKSDPYGACLAVAR